MELFFDTETSDLPGKKQDYKDSEYPWIVQLACVLSTEERIYTQFSTIIQSRGRSIHPKAQEVHEISAVESDSGMGQAGAIGILHGICELADKLVCHNFDFDLGFIDAAFYRLPLKNPMEGMKHFCTMKESTDLCKLPGRYGKYKWPKLEELYRFLFNEDFEGAHDALADVMATRRCYYELKKRNPSINN